MKRKNLWSYLTAAFVALMSVSLLAGYYPISREQRPGLFTDISVMTPDLDIVLLDTFLSGKKSFVFYFLPGCPHCEDAAPSVARLAQKYGQDVTFLGISTGRGSLTELSAFKERYGLPFSVVQDASGVFGSRNGLRGTPAFLLTYGDATPPETFNGFTHELELVLEVALRRHLGRDALELLNSERYVGSQVCSVCHRSEFISWAGSFHGISFSSLLLSGRQDDKGCVRCHTLGAGQKGGFESYESTLFAASVGCEACHGRSGGHLKKLEPVLEGGPAPVGGPVAPSSLEERYGPLCIQCHDATHRASWDLKQALALVSHQRNQNLSESELNARRTSLVKGEISRTFQNPVSGALAGSESCKPCHEAAYAGWAGSKHALAMKSLQAEGASDKLECLACHATKKPQTSGQSADEWIPGVSCEVCHGSGEAHVKAKGGKDNIGILQGMALECVLQRRCGTCHDAQNDPSFSLEAELTRLKKLHRNR